MRRIFSWMMLTLLLVGTLTLAFNAGLVHAQAEAVYINSDGSVVPSSAPISSFDNVTYTFMGNMSYPTYNGIVVERNNIVIDGNGYMVQGKTIGTISGLSLSGVSNVTIENANIQGFYYGIYLNDSNNNVINCNNATANGYGICLGSSSNNTVIGNNVTVNSNGIYLYSSSNNTVSGNSATANIWGIYLDSSSGNVLSANVIEDNVYNFYASGSVLRDFINSVDALNLVNGKPSIT